MRVLRRAVLAHRGWRYRTRVDPDEIRWMLSMLRPGDVAVDIGAYKGGYTYWMRRAVRDAGTVVAFEPQAELATYLRRCGRDFGWTNVRVEDVALSSEPGERMLHRPSAEPSPAASLGAVSLPAERASYGVTVDTLDRRLHALGIPTPVRLLKCDVEGHELEVFCGAVRTLTADKPLVLFECETRHLDGYGMEEVFGHLEALGYRGSFFWKGERLGVADFDARRHQVEGRRPYANNFVFAPAPELEAR